MALRLRIVSAHAHQLGESASKVFGVHGGTIGRAEDNDWVLPDPDRFISGHHIRIEYRQGEYWLADTSSNGTFINDSDQPIAQSGPRVLKSGDRLRMGDFELAVTVDAANDFPPDNSAIIAYDGVDNSSAARRVTAEDIGADLNLQDMLASDSSASLTPVNAWGQAVKSAAVPSRRRKPAHKRREEPEEEEDIQLEVSQPPQQQSEPQAAKQPREEVRKAEPAGEQPTWHLSTRRVEPYRNPLRSGAGAPNEAPTADSAASVQALFRGAGIDPSSLPTSAQTQALQLAGQMLREMVLGMMDVLQSRTEVKNRFRIAEPAVSGTQNSEYNPLQFSAGVDEALRKLFEAQNPASSRYLGPLEAVRESFHDLKVHQQAMTAAMQEAFQEFFSHLDPAELQERFDRGLKRGGLLGAATNKMKYWELYSEFFQSLSVNQRHELPHVFVEEFARSYAEKVTAAGTRRPRTSKAS